MVAADRSLAALAVLLGAACAAPPYAPCPVELAGPLPPDAFATCKRVLLEHYGSVIVEDVAAFRLQTDWHGSDNPPRERRATVFHEPAGLAVVVETRALVEPLFGLPRWSTVRGDPAAERELAGLLQEGLTPPR